MLICLLIIAIFVISLVLMFKTDEEDFFIFLCFADFLAMIICLILIIGAHAGTQIKIEKEIDTRQCLVKRMEIVDTEYEDVSKSDVIKEVYSYNTKVKSDKYYSKNLWTNWFYNKKVIDVEQIIEME